MDHKHLHTLLAVWCLCHQLGAPLAVRGCRPWSLQYAHKRTSLFSALCLAALLMSITNKVT